jgi:hypothetical protein
MKEFRYTARRPAELARTGPDQFGETILRFSLKTYFAVLLLASGHCMGQAPAALQARDSHEAIADTQGRMAGLLDSFVLETVASGQPCAIKPPNLVVADVPSYGSYDPDTNTLTSPAWEQMSTEEKSIFYKGTGPNAKEADAKAEFETGVHHWVIVHELGHWWEACRGMVDHGDHYSMELNADRIAAAYWNEHDPAVNAHQRAVFQAIQQKWPNPVPKGQTAMAYFNKNYDALGPTPAYIWFQAQMCLKAFAETPLPSFATALSKIKPN